MEKRSGQYVTIEIGDLKVGFSGNFPFRRFFEDSASPLHFHKYFEIHYVVSGEYIVNVDKEYRLNKGDIIIIPPDILHSSEKKRTSGWF